MESSINHEIKGENDGENEILLPLKKYLSVNPVSFYGTVIHESDDYIIYHVYSV